MDKVIKKNQEYIHGFMKVFLKRLLFNANVNRRLLYDKYINVDECNVDIIENIIVEIKKMKLRSWKYIIQNKIEDVKLYVKYKNKRKVFNKNKKEYSDYLALACIIKNEGRYIEEYIKFYLLNGVTRFYIFDNESTDNTFEILKPYIDDGTVVYFFYPGKKVQYAAYRQAIKYCKKRTTWLALLDADEFLYCKNGTLSDNLQVYEAYPALGINWTMFGPCGHEKRPDGLIIENYRDTFVNKNHEYNRRIKSIVQPKMVESVTSPHYCNYKKGLSAVDEEFRAINGKGTNTFLCSEAFTAKHIDGNFRINHYITKSMEELKEKCQRGYPDGAANPEYDVWINRFNEPLYEDKEIFKFVNMIKAM